jgi:hypothetical protein
MDLTADEIRMLLGMATRGLRDMRDSETNDLNHTDRMQLQEISEKVEDAYDDLRPWAPDVE